MMHLHDRMSRPRHQDVLDVDQLAGVHQAIAREIERRAFRQSLIRVALTDPSLNAMALQVVREIVALASPKRTHGLILLHRHPAYTHCLHKLKERGFVCFHIAERRADGKKQWRIEVRSSWLDAAALAGRLDPRPHP